MQHNVPINSPILPLKRGEETDFTTKNTISRYNYLMCTTKEKNLTFIRMKSPTFRVTNSIKRWKTSCDTVNASSIHPSTKGPLLLLLLPLPVLSSLKPDRSNAVRTEMTREGTGRQRSLLPSRNGSNYWQYRLQLWTLSAGHLTDIFFRSSEISFHFG